MPAGPSRNDRATLDNASATKHLGRGRLPSSDVTRVGTEAAEPTANERVPVRNRLVGPAHKLRSAVVGVSAIGLVALVGIAMRQMLVGGLAVVVLLGGLTFVMSAPRLRSYLLRNLPARGFAMLFVIGGLLLVGLLESAEPLSGRPLLLVVLGLAGLATGALADGLVANRFKVGLAHRGLGLEESLRWFDHSSGGFHSMLRSGDIVVLGLMTVLAGAVVVSDGRTSFDSVIPAVAGLILVGGIGLGVARLATLIQASQGSARQRARLGEAVSGLAPEFIVHFSGGIRALYQLGHWISSIEATGRPWLLVCRERATFEAAADQVAGPSLLVEDYGDLDLAIVDTVGIVFYVNTGTKNNHVIRFEEPVHVQLHHGESDKPPSGGKTMRLYDAHFVAGPAARTRLMEAGVATDRIYEVGRPVTDAVAVADARSDAILYAPTWEGAHADSDLSSVARIGESLVEALLATGRHVVFRAHPLTGTADPAAAVAARRIRAIVESEGGTIDDGSDSLIDAFASAGLLVADVSSVLVDWYAVDRPVLVTDVNGLGVDSLHARYPTTAGAGVIGDSLSGIAAQIEEAFTADPMQSARAVAARETLGEVGSAQARFAASVDAVRRPR